MLAYSDPFINSLELTFIRLLQFLLVVCRERVISLNTSTVLDVCRFVTHLRVTHPMTVITSFELANDLNVLRCLVQEKHF